MFWKFLKKIRKADALESSVSAGHSNVDTHNSPAKYANFDFRRAVLDWRDQHIENVELHLARELTSLYNALDEKTDKMSVRDIFSQKRFCKANIEPIFKSWVEREVVHLVNAAQSDLSTVFSHALEFGEHGAALNNSESRGHYTDAAIAVAAMVVGIVAIPVGATFSVVSAVGFMGILGVTTIEMPILAISVAVVGGLLMLALYKLTGFKSRAMSRYRKAVKDAINAQVLGYNSEKGSIRQRLQSYLEKTAEKIILEIDQC